MSNEYHYLVVLRDESKSDYIYNRVKVNKNQTYFVVPTSKLQKGHTYVWCVYSVDASGNRTYTPSQRFGIEYGDSITGKDTHLGLVSYSSASNINYFVSVQTSSYDSILNQAAQNWNNISSKVYLYRDYSNATKKLGIWEYNDLNGHCGYTFYKGFSEQFYPNIYTDDIRVSYIDVLISKTAIESRYNTNVEYPKAIAMHEIGHALSLAHTDGSDQGMVGAPVNNDISTTIDGFPNYLIMNTEGLNPSINANTVITTTDKDHLRIKWGA